MKEKLQELSRVALRAIALIRNLLGCFIAFTLSTLAAGREAMVMYKQERIINLRVLRLCKEMKNREGKEILL